MNFYNEYEPYPLQWIRNLADSSLIPKGFYEEKSIIDITPNELIGFRQCHFFAGLGGWPYALRLAGWPSEQEVWTGSCPCQPFSTAGQGKGRSDERHLWPAFRWLISVRKPPVIFGEQVASDLGRQWLSGVRADLEALGYEVGAADLCAAGVGAPHIRQRLFWVAYSNLSKLHKRTSGGQQPFCNEMSRAFGMDNSFDERLQGYFRDELGGDKSGRKQKKEDRPASTTSGDCGMADMQSEQVGNDGQSLESSDAWSRYILIPCTDGKARRIEPGIMPLAYGVPCRVGAIKAYGNAIVPQIAAKFVRAFMEAIL